MKLGIVGLPNVGKSTLFNAITNAGAQSANYPFCTIEPNVGVVAVPDKRLDKLAEMYDPDKYTPASIEFVDIAGLVKGASKGEGLGNQFLANIREVDAIVHVVRCFEDPNVIHVDGSIDPLRDIETIDLELIFADLEVLERRISKTAKSARMDKEAAKELEFQERLKKLLEDGKDAILMELQNEDEEKWIAEYNLLTEGVGWWNVGMASSRDANNGYEQWALMSGVARVMYNFKDRYMLTGTFRADGSSRFAKKKWGYFPSIAAAWTLSNEDFMKDVSSVQDIKLRASYGIVGSQAISPYATMGLMSATAYNFGTNSNFTGYWANDIATPELTWEKTKQFDLGLEFSLFDRRLNFSVDYFYKRTTDALLKRSIPGYVGGNSFWVNDGEISNRGIDLSVTARIMQNDRFQWTSTLNGTYLKNRVERLSGGENDFINGSSPAAGMVDYATIIKPGEAIGTFWGYEWTGLDEKGHDTYTDVDGNQMIDGGDRKVIGKANPDFTLGWNNSLSYKNWDLNLFFNGSFGAKRLNLVRYTMASAEGNSRFVTLADAYLKGFDKIGSSATYPSLTEGGNNLQPVSTKWLENADFLRLENISLSYTFPKKTTGFADLRLTFSCQNLFTITGYKGMDPAGTTFSNSSVDVDAGIDMGAYPSPRTFTFGLRMNF